MTDTMIKGTGNSRTLRTVPNALTLYSTHEAMIQAMIDGTFPIDLGGLQTVGIDQKGTDLNKANLLKDATAALFGKTSTATVDDILAAIRLLITTAQDTAQNAIDQIGTLPRIETGSYVGSYSGTHKAFTLNFSITWQLLIILGGSGSSRWGGIVLKNGSVGTGFGSNSTYLTVSSSAKSVSITAPNGGLDNNGTTFYYVAVGKP